MVQGREIKEFTAVSQTKTIKKQLMSLKQGRLKGFKQFKISSQELGMLSHVMIYWGVAIRKC